jgi:GNAT superfamily N-acetyltransferase
MVRHFTADYVERATLRDGTRVVLRLIVPEDAVILRRGFEKWSPESRYTRFLAPKTHLSDEELRYLTDVDQETHFALGAISEDGDSHGEPIGLGIARFIRLPDVDPPTAEAAVAVADEIHGLGLGRLLFLRLAAAAAERGIERFRCDVLCSNAGMKALIDELAPDRSLEVSTGVMSIDFPIPQVPADAAEPPAGPMYRFFRAAAEGTIGRVRNFLRRD